HTHLLERAEGAEARGRGDHRAGGIGGGRGETARRLDEGKQAGRVLAAWRVYGPLAHGAGGMQEMSHGSGVLVIAEQRGGGLSPVVNELVTAGTSLVGQIGGSVTVGLVGADLDALAASAAGIA